MEKIDLALSMGNSWFGPVLLLVWMGVAAILALAVALTTVYELVTFQTFYGTGSWTGSLIILKVLYDQLYLNTDDGNTEEHLIFANTPGGQALKKRWTGKKIPVVTLYDSYFGLDCDFNGDVYEVLLNHRYEFICWRPTFELCKFLLLQFIPGSSSSFKDKLSTKKEIADHYDRGNDFFACFLGPAMVYTSGVFHGTDQTLEQAQFNKMNMICDKLQIKEGQRTLDIGCGWGTLVRHCAREYGAKASGVTLSQEGAKWCRDKNREEFGSEDATEIMVCDYRDIKHKKFHAISSIEMAEHVGLANFQIYLKKVRDLLEDDGMFVCQVSGIRQAPNWEDVMWGLFMSRYIFPGADASTPAWWYTKEFEKAGFNVHSLENVSIHYAHTLHRWYLNWIKPEHKAHTLKVFGEKGGERLYRLWAIFLAWSSLAPATGYGSCLQFMVHPSTRDFPCDIFCNPGKENTSGGNIIGVGLHKDNM